MMLTHLITVLGALAVPIMAMVNPSVSLSDAPVSASTSASPAASSGVTTSTRTLPEHMLVAAWSVWAEATVMPTADQLTGVTHIVLSFADMTTWATFATATPSSFTASTISQLRVVSSAKILASFGGWNLDLPFRPASSNNSSRQTFAHNVAKFVADFGLDGADIDWEFPVDGGQSYHLDSSDPDARPYDASDAQNFVDLMTAIRAVLPQDKLLSMDVPARHADMKAYDMTGIVPGLDKSVDYWNLMTYDAMNRRDNTSAYHAGLAIVDDSYSYYTGKGIDPQKLVVGFPMYAKWFSSASACTADPPIGYDLGVAYELPNGTDATTSGVAVWNTVLNTVFTPITALNSKVAASFPSLTSHESNGTVGASAWFDTANSLFWTWVGPQDISTTCDKYKDKVRGMALWSLNQDAAGSPHISAISKCLQG